MMPTPILILELNAIKTYGHVLALDLRVMDSTAIALCKENNIPILVFDLSVGGNIRRAVMGESIPGGGFRN